MKLLNLLFIALLILFIGCNKPINQSTILTNHLEKLMKDDYKENGNYLVINNSGCSGCSSKNILFLKDNSQYLKQYKALIMSESVVDLFPYVQKLRIIKYIDTTNALDRLNTGITGFSVVSIENNIVVKKINSNISISMEEQQIRDFINIENKEIEQISNSKFMELDRVEFEQKFKNTDIKTNILKRKTLLYFTSDYCSPCKIFHPIIDSLSSIYSDSVDFYYIKSNRKDNMKIFANYHIMATPTLLIFRKEKPTIEKIGIKNTEEIVELLFNETK